MKSITAFLILLAAATVTAQTSAPAKPVRVSAAVMAANVIDHPDPICSPEHKGDKLAGTIVLDVIIAPDGRVADLNVVSGPESLRGCVIDAVGQWTYKPFRLDGQPTAVQTTLTISFDSGSPKAAGTMSFGGA